MTYTTVMVGLSVDGSNEARLEIAAQLAERFAARVLGITAAHFGPPPYFISGERAQNLLEQDKVAVRNRAAELEAEFRAALQNRVSEVEWRSAEDFPSRYIVEQARAADIIVVGEADRGAIVDDPFVHINPGDLVLQAGRPLLVVPDACDGLDIRSVLIAWKDTPEARRAITDALPMLRKAADVTVVEIAGERAQAAARSRVADVVAWLSRHGVTATGQAPSACGETGSQLDTIASNVGAGLVVAGAYGHSRFREWIFGGVTQRLINPSGRCSFLSR